MEVGQLFHQLTAAFETKNYANAQEILKKLKLLLIQEGTFICLHPTNSDLNRLARDSLEIGAYLSLFSENIEEFVRYMNHLVPFYFENNAEESPRMYPLIGLHLLRFLVQHQLSDFHVLLERLSYSAINHNPYIKGPLVLEQFLMEGNFLKAWQACSNAPGDEYKFFMLLMMTSLREEVMECIEKAYEELPVQRAVELLFCHPSELEALILVKNWKVINGDLIVFPTKTEPVEKSLLVNSFQQRTIESLGRNLFVAKELERII